MIKKIIILSLKIIVSIVLFSFAVHEIQLDIIKETVSKINFNFFVLALMINILAIIVGSVKWAYLIPSVPFKRLIIISVISRFFSLILPGQIAGEGAKIVLTGYNRNDSQIITASVLFDKITGIAAVFVVSIAGFLFSDLTLPDLLLFSLILALALIILICILLLNERSFQFITGKIIYFSKYKPLKKITIHIREALSEIRYFLKKPKVILINFIGGCIYQLLAVALIYCFAYTLEISLSFSDFCWIFGFITIALILPVTIAGLGVREVSFIGILGALGIASEKAMALSLLFFTIQIFDAIAGGGLYLTGIYKSK